MGVYLPIVVGGSVEPPASEGYEQLINYTMVYDEGNECADVGGGWTKASGDIYGTITKNATKITLASAAKGGWLGIRTANKVDLSQYVGLGAVYHSYAAVSSVPAFAIGVAPESELQPTIFPTADHPNVSCTSLDSIPIGGAALLHKLVDGTKTEHYPFLSIGCPSVYSLDMKNFFAYKEDPYVDLCKKAKVETPNNLDSLLADTSALTSIFNNEDAVNFMVAQCTGDFMVGVLNNPYAVGLLSQSPYLNTVIGNPHWAKFIMMLNAKGQLVPNEYQQVEYIQSSGSQHINTGIKIGANTETRIDYQRVNLTVPHNVLGGVGTGKGYRIEYYNSPYYEQVIVNDVAYYKQNNSDRHYAVINDINHNTYMDGELLCTLIPNATTADLILFGVGIEDGTIKNKASAKIWACQILDAGRIVRDYVPCYRKSDNVAGLYDIVEGKFYSNAGTGSFEVGADKGISLLNVTMLYDAGNNDTSLTGGWKYCCKNSGASQSITENADHLLFTGSNMRGAGAGICSVNDIAVNEYEAFHVNMKMVSYTKQDSYTPQIRARVGDENETYGFYAGDASDPYCCNVKATSFKGLLTVNNLSALTSAQKVGAYIGDISAVTGKVYHVFFTKSDDWQTWKDIAGITASSLDTLLADSTAMNKIMSNEAAVKYLRGCTGDLMLAICNSETAMQAVVNNIAYDYLFDHPVWYKFITMCPTSLAAMDSVAVTVPTMTSNTTPSGEITVSGVYESYSAYKAFDKDGSTRWAAQNGSGNKYIAYEFTEKIDLYRLEITGAILGDNAQADTGVLKCGDDLNSLLPIATLTGMASTPYVYKLSKPISAKVVALDGLVRKDKDTAYTCFVQELQYYGKAVD